MLNHPTNNTQETSFPDHTLQLTRTPYLLIVKLQRIFDKQIDGHASICSKRDSCFAHVVVLGDVDAGDGKRDALVGQVRLSHDHARGLGTVLGKVAHLRQAKQAHTPAAHTRVHKTHDGTWRKGRQIELVRERSIHKIWLD